MLVDQAILGNLIDMVDGATPEGSEGRITIPATVLPVAPVFRPLIRAAGGDDPMRLSAQRVNASFQNASDAGGSVNLLRLASGLWQIQIRHSFISDFVQNIAGAGPHSEVHLRFPDNVAASVSAIFATVTQQNVIFDFWLPARIRPGEVNQYFQIFLTTGATGVGETTRTQVSVQANKLL